MQTIARHASLLTPCTLKMVTVYSVLIPIAKFVVEIKPPCATNVLMASSSKTMSVFYAQPTAKDALRMESVPIVWMAMDIQMVCVSPVRAVVKPVPMLAPSAKNALKECMWIPMEIVTYVPVPAGLVIPPKPVPPTKKEKFNSEH